MKTKAICFAVAYTLANNAIAASGCCSWHGGVAGCSASGKSVCADGTTSPSCTCTPTGTGSSGGSTAQCTAKSETRTVACQANMSGEKTQQREYSCITATLGTWSSWRDVSTTCAYKAFSGTVTKVTDGDTIQVKYGWQYKTIRLAEIDAPESCQAHGDQSRYALVQLLLNRTVEVTPSDTDPYGRLVAHVTGSNFAGTVSAYQVEHGNAWVYDDYATDPALNTLEQTARDGKVGLWADENPMAPWEWRRGDYPCVSMCK